MLKKLNTRPEAGKAFYTGIQPIHHVLSSNGSVERPRTHLIIQIMN